MKVKHSLTLLFPAALALCAFGPAPAPASMADPSMSIQFVTDFQSDGSGALSFEMELSKEFMALMKTFSSGDETINCQTFFESSYDDWEMSEQENDGALACTASRTFADLDEYENLVVGEYGSASFERLEISGGRLYYDLIPNIAGSSIFGEVESGAGFDVEAFWVLKMPGEVESSNADETSGQTLTWDILKMNSASHIRAESQTGGGGVLGLDPTLTAIAIIGLLGCCCLIILIAGVVVFLVLRKKNNPAPAAAG